MITVTYSDGSKRTAQGTAFTVGDGVLYVYPDWEHTEESDRVDTFPLEGLTSLTQS